MNFLSKLFKTKSNPVGEGNHSPRMAVSDTSDYAWSQLAHDPYQLGGSFAGMGSVEDNTLVSAGIRIISETLSSLKLEHIRREPNGRETVVYDSAAARLLYQPNGFSTQQEFILDLVIDVITNGNGYAYASRNGRHEVDALYLSECVPYWHLEYGGMWYGIEGDLMCMDLVNRFKDKKPALPDRDVLHVRTASSKGTYLVGESILKKLAKPAGIASAIEAQNLNYFENAGRINGYISTEMQLTALQVSELRKRLEETMASARANPRNAVPILTNGLQYKNMEGFSNLDSDLARVYKIQAEQIADIMRVPSSLLSVSQNDTSGNSTEKLREWKSNGLKYWTSLIENAFNKLLVLDGHSEFIRFNVSKFALGDEKDHIEALTSSVNHGILSVNEARERLGGVNAETKDCFKPRVQMQLCEVGAFVPESGDKTDNQMLSHENDEKSVNEKSILWMYNN